MSSSLKINRPLTADTINGRATVDEEVARLHVSSRAAVVKWRPATLIGSVNVTPVLD